MLCLDVGDKNIGVAISDELQLGAYPFDIIKRDGNEILKIEEIVKGKNIKKVIVGLPRTLKGEVGIQAEKVMSFVESLKSKNMGIEVIFWDERLTSVIAGRIFQESRVRQKQSRAIKDSLEAALILESYLESKKNERKEQI